MITKKHKLIIYGTGKLAEYAYFVFTHDSEYEVVCFCIETEFMPSTTQHRLGLPIYDLGKIAEHFPSVEYHIFVAVGNNSVRDRIYAKISTMNYTFANYLSSKSQYWFDCQLGNNVFISEGCVIQPFVSIGNNTLIFSSIIGHHSTIETNVTLSGCTIGGSVTVEKNTFIGMNATINQNLKVGMNNIIGVGCNIIRDTRDGEVYSAIKSKLRLFSSSRIFSNFLK
ncbi:acetyltransferase [Emticicia sp. SJ17W-69]|uniref:acetyltransferase n=1 Tax=Emticicia sp. SJ17W-69 TaxID=3421657 RepID=UPI003EBC9E36